MTVTHYYDDPPPDPAPTALAKPDEPPQTQISLDPALILGRFADAMRELRETSAVLMAVKGGGAKLPAQETIPMHDPRAYPDTPPPTDPEQPPPPNPHELATYAVGVLVEYAAWARPNMTLAEAKQTVSTLPSDGLLTAFGGMKLADAKQYLPMAQGVIRQTLQTWAEGGQT